MRFLSMKEVCRITTLSPTHIRRLIEAKTFPELKPLGVGWRCRKAFVDVAVYAWMKSKGYPVTD
jgi:excisionase family DNA binding protein